MRKTVYIIILLFCFSCSLEAQKKYIYQDSALQTEQQVETPPVVDEPVHDSEVYTGNQQESGPDTTLYYSNHSIPRDSILKWSKTKGFEYIPTLDSLLKEQKEKPKPQNQSQGSYEIRQPGAMSSFFASGIFEAIMWALAICFVLFILYRLFLVQGAFKRTVKAKERIEPEVTEQEEVSDPNELDARIRQAADAGNFRLAVRYQYLKTLHKLAGQERIELAADKTNYQYVRELKDYNQQNEFAALTLNYDYVWYGEFHIGRDIYDRIAADFTAFNRKW